MFKHFCKKLTVVFWLLIPLTPIYAASQFVVKKIVVNGLQRVSRATVLNYLPVKTGDVLKDDQTSQLISKLYKTGFFSNISLAREGDDLIVNVAERRVISQINYSGNKVLKTEKLQDALKQLNFTKGQVYDPNVIKNVEQGIEEQYHNFGYYDTNVDINVTQLSRARIKVDINVEEGSIAKIKQIKIIGANAYPSSLLISKFALSTPTLFSFLSNDDQYSREKLEADLETLRSYYMDRGYFRFNIDSSQVSLSPDKTGVYITIHVTEGAIYRVNDIKLSGNLLKSKDDLNKLLLIKQGDEFSRDDVMNTSSLMTQYLAEKGYAFAQVNPVPDIDDKSHTVSLNFAVNPGNLVYVRRITFTGNDKTYDDVLRKNVLQTEGGLFSLSNIQESKRLLYNLSYLTDINFKMNPVPGKPNQADLDYSVKEKPSAQIMAQFGYSGGYGLMWGLNFSQSNLFGTGKALQFSFQQNKSNTNYNVGYFNPYYTLSGISRSLNLYYSKMDTKNTVIQNYAMNRVGGSVSYGIPILSQDNYLSLGYSVEHLSVIPGQQGMDEVVADFINNNGSTFNQLGLIFGFTHSHLDRALLPQEGNKVSLNVKVGVPIKTDSLGYYQANLDGDWYKPLFGTNFILRLGGTIGYGDGFGNVKSLPFFNNYLAGGIGSVAGFEPLSLGPVDENGHTIGGSSQLMGRVNLIFPNHISDSVRTALFYNIGNVFAHRIEPDELRSSAGLGLSWISPMGPLQFALSTPIKSEPGDQTEGFQFTISSSF